MLTPSADTRRGRTARMATLREGAGLPRSTRYDRGDITRGRAHVPEGKGQGQGQKQGRTLFTTAEAAAQLGISHDAVKMAVRNGTLTAESINPRLNMITAEAIEAYRRAHLGRRGRPKGAKNKPKAAPTDAPSPIGQEGNR